MWLSAGDVLLMLASMLASLPSWEPVQCEAHFATALQKQAKLYTACKVGCASPLMHDS